jgi:hypothetical protein
MIPEREILSWKVSTCVDIEVSARSPYVQEVLVDSQSVVRRDVFANGVDPARIVDQPLEHIASVDDILEVNTILFPVALSLNLSDPAGVAFFIFWPLDVIPMIIYPLVHTLQVSYVDGSLQNQITVEIEKVVAHLLVHHSSASQQIALFCGSVCVFFSIDTPKSAASISDQSRRLAKLHARPLHPGVIS